MLPFRTFARRTLSCSSSVLRKCKPPKDSGCECQQPKEPCQPKGPKQPKGADRQCEAGPHGPPAPARDSGIPDHCCKENALECARKLQALQKQWEAVAAACDPGERAAPRNKRPACPVQPPARDNGGVSPAVLLIAGAAVLAGIVWLILENTDKLDKEKVEEIKEDEPT